jgi:hypothetical protein
VALFQAMLLTGRPSVRLQDQDHRPCRLAGGRLLRNTRDEPCRHVTTGPVVSLTSDESACITHFVTMPQCQALQRQLPKQKLAQGSVNSAYYVILG